MCGIAGIIDPAGINPSDLSKMAKAIRHRGPDDEGYVLINPETNKIKYFRGDDTIPEKRKFEYLNNAQKEPGFTTGILHRRLSIIDLSENGHQPMFCLDERYIIVLNGEIYNYIEIRKELSAKGYNFFSESDTEVVALSFDCWGKECVNRFVGMWAFAVYDVKEKILFLSRDRFGIKPLYYCFNNGTFAFASEIKALLSSNIIESKADLQACAEYLYYGSVIKTQDTLFKNIMSLNAGCNLVYNVRTSDFSLFSYYDLEENVENNIISVSGNSVVEQFREKFTDAILLHLRADVPVGSCLSGGLDSSSIVAFSFPHADNNIFKTFTASYPGSPVDETNYANLVINSFPGIEPHYCEPVIGNYWNDLDKLIWHQDLPIGSTSMYAQWEVMKLAGSQGMKVLLDGQGADEILGGYYPFAGIYLIDMLKKLRFAGFFSEKRKLSQNFTKHVNEDFARALYYFLPREIQKYLRKRNRIGGRFIRSDFRVLAEKVEMQSPGGKNFREFSYAALHYTLQDLLRYEDRNSMAFSIESRVPFLDHRLVEFSIGLDNHWKIQNGFTKFVLRKSSEPYLNPEVIWRKEKFGFLTPQNEWKTEFKSGLNDYLQNYHFPDFLDSSFIIKTCNNELEGNTPVSEFWKLISFLKWIEVFKVNFS